MAPLYLLVFLAGAAGLSWEVLWQLEASLAIGISARGTAVVLATTMGGMALGSALSGRLLAKRRVASPLRVYGALEATIGVLGVFVLFAGLALVERADTRLYAAQPALASVLHVAGLAFVLGPPAMAMGATIPAFGLLARAMRTSVSVLYAINTAGACVGVLLASFVLLPHLGVTLTAVTTASVNLGVGLVAMFGQVELGDVSGPEEEDARAPARGGMAVWLVVLASGFLCFALEVAWFRALRAAFLATTHGFAAMLAAVLGALAFGARVAKGLERKGISLGAALAGAGVAALLATPLLERFDVLAAWAAHLSPGLLTLTWLVATFLVIGPSIVLLGTCLPWVLDRYVEPRQWGRVYAANTVASVAGSLGAAWILLPLLGFARTSWLLGAAATAVGLLLLPSKRARTIATLTTALALGVAVVTASGVGRARVISNVGATIERVVAFQEGPDATVAVVDGRNNHRALLIDGFEAASGPAIGSHYMIWMGRLPMVLHPDPKRALVICFGTGQTANAVRSEGPASLDIVDVNATVFRMAPYFAANEHVLDDPRVHAIVMDGRAWLRRTANRYDVITLEPMPPTFAGVNALYSREFYELARERLDAGGVAAQWLPIHILSTDDAASIVAAFQQVFPDAILWLDPLGATGILVGRKDERTDLGTEWPGLSRTDIARDLPPDVVRKFTLLDARGLAVYASLAEAVTDDNQLLAYGPKRYRFFGANQDAANLAILSQLEERFPPAIRRRRP